ncbi:hypothetical protein PMI16_04226 [Herbaspirillum sp. CF444]|nr:hypothetical protein PMI16_04226 [Herbaspirillum sp. CF444]
MEIGRLNRKVQSQMNSDSSLDHFGMGEMTPLSAQVLLNVVDRRVHSGSLMIFLAPPHTQLREKANDACRITFYFKLAVD